jgi:hypothetical protein
MKRKRVDIAHSFMATAIKSKPRGTDKELIEDIFQAQVQSARFAARHASEKRRKRERGLRSRNDSRRNKAKRDYQEYRDIAGQVIAESPLLRRATRHKPAQLVRDKLIEQGRGAVEIRAIAAERQLLRAKDDYDRAVAQAAHQAALRELERLKGAERG